ncbi:MAG TPA: hypothetical protein VJJ47_03535 [Candidatus Paceibacterota bacterium]
MNTPHIVWLPLLAIFASLGYFLFRESSRGFAWRCRRVEAKIASLDASVGLLGAEIESVEGWPASETRDIIVANLRREEQKLQRRHDRLQAKLRDLNAAIFHG